MEEDNRILEYYNFLLERGDLLEIYPHLSGNYEKDKKFFLKEYNKLKQYL